MSSLSELNSALVENESTVRESSPKKRTRKGYKVSAKQNGTVNGTMNETETKKMNETEQLDFLFTVLRTGNVFIEIPWNRYTISTLRIVLRDCFSQKLLKLSGIPPPYKLKKQQIVDLIETRIQQIKPLIRIQALARRFLVRCYFYYRGPGLLYRNRCVNETDFASLEPIQYVNHYYYFGIEENNSIYGFNICSLLQMIVKSKKYKELENAKNPYTRSTFPLIERLSRLISLTYLIFKEIEFVEEINSIIRDIPVNNYQVREITNVITNITTPVPAYVPNGGYTVVDDFNPSLFTPTERTPGYVFEHTYYFFRNNLDVINPEYFYAYRDFFLRANIQYIDSEYRRILAKRGLPIMTRIAELFADIDRYGHFTNPTWLTFLTINQLSIFMKKLVEVWNRIQYQSKIRICPISPLTVYIMSDVNLNYIYNPYGQHITTNNNTIHYVDTENPGLVWRDTESEITNYDPLTASPEQHIELEQYHKMKYILNFAECLTVAGYTREDRDLGVMNFLSALAEVSEPCRTAIPYVFQG